MFNVIYTEKLNDGSLVIERENKVSISQKYLKDSLYDEHCRIACTGDTKDGFCVYVNENPETALCNNKKHQIINKTCGNRFDDENKYINVLNCVHYLARAINRAYKNGDSEFDVDDWLIKHNYA